VWLRVYETKWRCAIFNAANQEWGSDVWLSNDLHLWRREFSYPKGMIRAFFGRETCTRF
jgi:hypothetical protein